LQVLIKILLLFIFLSKVSFAFVPGFPQQLSFLLFQNGMHPFVNLFVNVTIGGLVLFIFLLSKKHENFQNKTYKFYLFLFSVFLLSITLSQSLFIESDNSALMQILSALSAIATVYLYGRAIPCEYKVENFFAFTKKSTIFLCLVSLMSLILFPGVAFKGGRFIGIFKHIPYMVTVATVACTFLIYELVYLNQSRLRKLVYSLIFLVCFIMLILTGTRSALFAVILSYFLSVLFFPSVKPTTQFLKVSLGLGVVLASLLFGPMIIDYTIGIVRGENSIGLRAAQDGVSSRIDEVERGFEIFKKNPWLGQGLLSKFADINENNAGGYNANKDPHNIMVSAGVIGGAGFIAVIVLGLLGLFIIAFKRVRSSAPEVKILAIYILTQLPILMIYHVHLSLGGMADRLYWLIIGFLMINYSKKQQQQN